MKPMISLVLIFALAFLLGGISACGPVKGETPGMTAEESVVFPVLSSASPVKGVALRGADEAAVLELAAALVESGLKEDGYDHIVLSDWQSSALMKKSVRKTRKCNSMCSLTAKSSSGRKCFMQV